LALTSLNRCTYHKDHRGAAEQATLHRASCITSRNHFCSRKNNVTWFSDIGFTLQLWQRREKRERVEEKNQVLIFKMSKLMWKSQMENKYGAQNNHLATSSPDQFKRDMLLSSLV